MTNWNHNIISDDEKGRPFVHKLGYAIVNCSTLEQLTYTYVATLTGDHLFGTGMGKSRFSERVARVNQLIAETTISDDLRDRTFGLWEKAQSIMDRRNLIAHNPVSRVRHNQATGGGYELLAVVDMSHSTPERYEVFDAAKLANLANQAKAISDALFECLARIQGELSDRG